MLFNADDSLGRIDADNLPADQGRYLAKALWTGVLDVQQDIEVDLSRAPAGLLISSFFDAFLKETHKLSCDHESSLVPLARRLKWRTAFPFQQEAITRWMMRPSANVVIIHNGKIAAIRSRKHGGALEIPGGKAEFGESPETNAIRECLEEIGRVPLLSELLLTEPVGGFMCSTFLDRLDSTELISSSEGEAVWATPEELLTGTYAEHTKKWLQLEPVIKALAVRHAPIGEPNELTTRLTKVKEAWARCRLQLHGSIECEAMDTALRDDTDTSARSAGAAPRRVTPDGYTQLPQIMIDALQLGNGGHLWFLKGAERWEAWLEADLQESFDASPARRGDPAVTDPAVTPEALKAAALKAADEAVVVRSEDRESASGQRSTVEWYVAILHDVSSIIVRDRILSEQQAELHAELVRRVMRGVVEKALAAKP